MCVRGSALGGATARPHDLDAVGLNRGTRDAGEKGGGVTLNVPYLLLLDLSVFHSKC
jgi:hypothetical protein